MPRVATGLVAVLLDGKDFLLDLPPGRGAAVELKIFHPSLFFQFRDRAVDRFDEPVEADRVDQRRDPSQRQAELRVEQGLS